MNLKLTSTNVKNCKLFPAKCTMYLHRLWAPYNLGTQKSATE